MSIPYGYCINDGRINLNLQESEVVKRIYSLYLSGDSYNSIARLLQGEGVSYGEGYCFNKNIVGRILNNEKYYGNDKYPCIVEKAVFNKVAEQIKGNSSRKEIDKGLLLLKSLLYCDNCGNRMNNQYGKWLCTKCDSKAKLKNEEFAEKTVRLINSLIDYPDSVEIQPFKQYTSNMEIKRLENDINRELEKLDSDEEYTKSLIESLVDLKYSMCDDGDSARQGKRIQELLQKSKRSEKLNTELLIGIADRIIVQKDGDFFLILKNGQEIK